MVVKMMRRWRPWPPLVSSKFEVNLVVKGLSGVRLGEGVKAAAEVKWKGPRTALMSSLRRSVRRNTTRQAEPSPVPKAPKSEEPEIMEVAVAEAEEKAGFVDWSEEFQCVCTLGGPKDGAFHPWEVSFVVFNGSNNGVRNKLSVMGSASLNLAEFTSVATEREIELNIPLSSAGSSVESTLSLQLSLRILELRSAQSSTENTTQRAVVPVPLSPTPGYAPEEKSDISALKAGLRKVKILTELVSTRKSRKTYKEDELSEGRYSGRSDEVDYGYPFDTDSADDGIDVEVEDGKENSKVRKSFNYGTLASANHVGGTLVNNESEDWVYYSHRRSDVGCSQGETSSSVNEQSHIQSSKKIILPWRKRKLSFRSPKAKGEPLLNKEYGEEGGDDIDFDRRQMSSSDESFRRQKAEDEAAANLSLAAFGDDNFVIGNWEAKELTSRDGKMKIYTQVFFASIDQRSERAAGESACTALVAVIANWFQDNRDIMPIKSQFDGLIREGSLEWRNLCKNDIYRERFPDKHFDLDTVLEAKTRPLSVVPGKSFIGFFHPECDVANSDGFEFLNEAMSFDSIWDEISRTRSEDPSDLSPHIYIVSWNDHFFVLKVDQEAYYIVDTLGERLYEGCNQAYILKFDKDTTIQKMNEEKGKSGEALDTGKQQASQNGSKSAPVEVDSEGGNNKEKEVLVCAGKESCKEYIKSFLAAIPIRELLVDIKKGLMASTPLHHRLQIEFHYTEPSSYILGSATPPEQIMELLSSNQTSGTATPTEQVFEPQPSSQTVEFSTETEQVPEPLPSSIIMEPLSPSEKAEIATSTKVFMEQSLQQVQPIAT